jgi:hypothetical protein
VERVVEVHRRLLETFLGRDGTCFKFTEFLSVAPEFLYVNTDRHADRLELIYIPPREHGNYRE